MLLVGCISDSSKGSRDYIVNIDKPTSITLDSIIVTRIVDTDTVQFRFYDSTYVTSIKNDSVTTITLNFDFQESSTQNVSYSYVCFAEGIVVLISESSFGPGGDAKPPVVHRDSLLIAALKEYGAQSVDNDSLNEVLFDSLFISYMLRTPDDSTNRFYNAYKKKSGADTVRFIGYVLDTLKGRAADDSTALAQLKSVLPPGIDVLIIVGDVIINPPVKERLTFEGLFTAHVSTVHFVELQLTGDLIADSIVKQAAIDVENTGFKGFIDLPDLGVMYTIRVLVYDIDSILTGWYAKDFTTLALDITLPPFDAWNAKPWLHIDQPETGSIGDTVPLTFHFGDSLDSDSMISVEWKHGLGVFVFLSDSVALLPLPTTPTEDYPIVIKITDSQGNVTIDSTTSSATLDVPTIALTSSTYIVDTSDSLFFSWTTVDQYGSIVLYEFKGAHDVHWISTTTHASIGIAPVTTAGIYGYIVKAIDDDSNVVFDTTYVSVIEGKPVVAASVETARVSVGDVVNLHATASDSLGTIVSWEWKSGLDGVFVASSPNSSYSVAVPTVSNPLYPFVVRVTDDDGNSAYDTVFVDVVLDVPVVQLGNDTTITKKTAVSFTAVITQEFGAIERYHWDFNGDGVIDDSTSASNADWVFTSTGVDTLKLTVYDDDGNSAFSTQVITVLNTVPTIVDSIVSLYNKSSVDTLFYTIVADDENGDPLVYRILSGNDNALFSLDSITGELKLVVSLEFDLVIQHSLIIQASDGEDDSNAELVISITGTGSFVDTRDGQIYNMVKIGTQTWMAENLNYSGHDAGNSKTYDVGLCIGRNFALKDRQDSTSCDSLGRNYQWSEAMQVDSTFNLDDLSPIPTQDYQGVCPENWHIPNELEWEEMRLFVDSANGDPESNAGKSLRSTSGWGDDYEGISGNGTDLFSFTAVPGGVYTINPGGADFGWDVGQYITTFWSSTEVNSGEVIEASLLICFQSFCDNSDILSIYSGWNSKSSALSVRCVKD